MLTFLFFKVNINVRDPKSATEWQKSNFFLKKPQPSPPQKK